MGPERGHSRADGRHMVASLHAWNFALYSRRATGVTLLLYTADDPVHPIFEERLNPRINKSGRIWHCWMPAAAREAARLCMPIAWTGAAILRAATASIRRRCSSIRSLRRCSFRRTTIARGRAAGTKRWPRAARRAARSPRAVRREMTRPPRPSHDLIVYELHVKGFTARANSGVTPAAPRHLCRPDRKDSLPQEPGHHRGGTDAGASVRSAGRQLLGIHDAQLLFAASGTTPPATGSEGAAERVPRDGASVP